MKNVKKLMVLVVLASMALWATDAAMAGVDKVAVVHIGTTEIIPNEPGLTYPEPGIYLLEHVGKVIEVAEQAADVFVGHGDILLEDIDLFGSEAPVKGDTVVVGVLIQINLDGSTTILFGPVLGQ